jgi:hypothetical protein
MMTQTTLTDEPTISAPTVFFYWAVANTPAGDSDPSDVCKVTVVPV